MGIHSDAATAHQKLADLPDIQQVLQNQQTVAAATADIAGAVRTFSGNMVQKAQQEKAQAAADYEAYLKEQNDGSYERFMAQDSDRQHKQMLANDMAYAAADNASKDWGIGGSNSRALNAATTLITGALGGQTDVQVAANTLAPYAAASIGKQFGHGENQNAAAQAVAHFALGATLAYINGGDPLAGGSAAVAAEKAAQYLSRQYDDGQTARDPITGEFNPNLLPEDVKEEIRATTSAIAAVVGATGDNGAALNAQIAGVIGQNAAENNQFRWTSTTPDEVKKVPATASQNEFDLLGTMLPAHSALLSKDQQTKELNEFRAGLRRISGTGAIAAGYGPFIVVGGKPYLLVASSSIGTGVVTSTIVEGDNYMLSDLVYDATLGILTAKALDKATGKMISWSEADNKLFERTLDFKKQFINHGFGKAGSGTLQKYLKDNDITLIETPDWRQKIKVNKNIRKVLDK